MPRTAKAKTVRKAKKAAKAPQAKAARDAQAAKAGLHPKTRTKPAPKRLASRG